MLLVCGEILDPLPILLSMPFRYDTLHPLYVQTLVVMLCASASPILLTYTHIPHARINFALHIMDDYGKSEALNKDQLHAKNFSPTNQSQLSIRVSFCCDKKCVSESIP